MFRCGSHLEGMNRLSLWAALCSLRLRGLDGYTKAVAVGRLRWRANEGAGLARRRVAAPRGGAVDRKGVLHEYCQPDCAGC